MIDNCIFCKIVAGNTNTKFLYEDEQLVVFKDINPKAKIHVLIVPKKHINSLAEVVIEDINLMGKMLFVAPKLAKKYDLSGFRIVINTGRDGGQIIDHIHFHLLGGEGLPKV